MCQPVAMTESHWRPTQGMSTVPTAMLCAASSIHQAPLSQSEPVCGRLSAPPALHGAEPQTPGLARKARIWPQHDLRAHLAL